MIAKQIVGSNLVKTAVHGADANWGRIISAIGQTTASVNPENVDISIGTIEMLKNSEASCFFRRNVPFNIYKVILFKYLWICIMAMQSEKHGDVTYPMTILRLMRAIVHRRDEK